MRPRSSLSTHVCVPYIPVCFTLHLACWKLMGSLLSLKCGRENSEAVSKSPIVILRDISTDFHISKGDNFHELFKISVPIRFDLRTYLTRSGSSAASGADLYQCFCLESLVCTMLHHARKKNSYALGNRYFLIIARSEK